MIDVLAVVGTGLIGTSAALAARRAGVARVTGWDAHPETLAVAAQRDAVEPAVSLAEALAAADVALVAVPVVDLPAVVRDVLAAAPDGCAVTDVGSTKGAVCAAAGDDPRFVGGHPICGAETSGPARATGELFDGATWFLTPLARTSPDRYREVHALVGALGARPVAIDPAAHDRLVALTSHLPHALANLLVNQAGDTRVEGHEPLAAAGGSLRDMTRIAGANPRIWVDILLDNREELAAALAEHRRRVSQVEGALAAGDAGFLARWIGEAAGNRRRLLETAYDDAGALQRVRVHVPDRPGVLAGVFQALGADRINVADFELDHRSHEQGGTLTILVSGEADAHRAAALLEAQGYGVVVAPVMET
jgi:prephenate dehydrogenase